MTLERELSNLAFSVSTYARNISFECNEVTCGKIKLMISVMSQHSHAFTCKLTDTTLFSKSNSLTNFAHAEMKIWFLKKII